MRHTIQGQALQIGLLAATGLGAFSLGALHRDDYSELLSSYEEQACYFWQHSETGVYLARFGTESVSATLHHVGDDYAMFTYTTGDAWRGNVTTITVPLDRLKVEFHGSD